ncbi:hypothetical protein C9374_008042 [Naegleria lovaniensis]|uniref:Uridine diphosphate glucose pyrophosphatase NUDT14 n=1 Tax=Naegleria lovaniensis TaxID=51637 RepID=A0AA88GGD1_NAELO|nr:uncharacterized protein C9374_008042 [Naegleria lovaniensis]KAG2378894.1 hypothetical protein C9374_008042 [Naegleria lovaniensis]
MNNLNVAASRPINLSFTLVHHHLSNQNVLIFLRGYPNTTKYKHLHGFYCSEINGRTFMHHSKFHDIHQNSRNDDHASNNCNSLNNLKISNVKIERDKHIESKWIRLQRMYYNQNGIEKTWDIAVTRDSVSCLIYQKSQKAFIIVKQFRPALFARQVTDLNQDPSGPNVILPEKIKFSFELCAGISDKNVSPVETIQAELEEECGFRIPLDKIQSVKTYYTGTASNASMQQLFYVEMDDESEKAWKINAGGGLESEGEIIEVFKLPLEHVHEFLTDTTTLKPATLFYAITWWFLEKASLQEQQHFYFNKTN